MSKKTKNFSLNSTQLQHTVFNKGNAFSLALSTCSAQQVVGTGVAVAKAPIKIAKDTAEV